MPRNWHRQSGRPRPFLTSGRRWVALSIDFIRARLSPTGYFGLHLTLGASILVAAGWFFGGIAEDVVSGDPLTVIDARVAAWFHGHAVPGTTRLMLLITHLHNLRGISMLALILALFLVWKRQWDWLVALIVVVPGGMLLNVLTKSAFRRERPTFADPLLALDTYSFPSGHVAAATLIYGLLAAFIVAKVEAWRGRVLITLLACLIVALVALSRVYLGVHYLSDILAAVAESLAWLALCLTAVDTLKRRYGTTS